MAVLPDDSIKEVRIPQSAERDHFKIQSPEFLEQYSGKTLKDRFTISRDIDSISGATKSVESINVAVKKALAVLWMIKE